MIDPTGPTARRFPLVARPRPACTPLPQRVADLLRRAKTASERGDLAAASAVFNLAALLAADCGLPNLARFWCLHLARLTQTTRPTTANEAIHGLEPFVNLARLSTRAGDGAAAWTLLEHLYQAIDTRQPATIDGIDIPVTALTADPDIHRRLRRWAWATLLASGSRALAVAGRWDDARIRLEHHHGIGNRMLDGRQIAVIAHATTGRHTTAQQLLRTTEPGDPWENAVTACLQRLCAPAPDPAHIAATYHQLDPPPAELTVVYTRLGLSLIDAVALAPPGEPTADPIITLVLQAATTDGYAARDVLAHPRSRAAATSQQVRHLTDLVTVCGLDAGHLPTPLQDDTTKALEMATAVIVAHRTGSPAN